MFALLRELDAFPVEDAVREMGLEYRKEKGKKVILIRGEKLGEDPSVVNKYLPRTTIVPSSRRRP